jgi:hypothetical protein
MKIFDKHATFYLMEKMYSLRHFHSSWRVLHLQLSNRSERFNRTMRTHFILKGLRHLLGDEDGYIYLCEDGDIIILFEGRMAPLLRKLSQYFADIDAQFATETLGHYFTTYDLSKDWERFSHMCHMKSLETDLWTRIRNLPAAPRPWEQAQVP